MPQDAKISDDVYKKIRHRIRGLEERMLFRLEYLEKAGALTGGENADLLMADLLTEALARYDIGQLDPQFKFLRSF